MKTHLNKYRTSIFASFLLLLFFSACKKQVTADLPGGQQDAAINFFSASDVMAIATGYNYSAIYVDKYQNKITPYDINYSTFPVIATGFDYPRSAGILSYAYYNYNKGSHELFFTDSSNTVVLDTTLRVNPRSFNCVYLADVPVSTQNTVATYKMISVQEDRADVPTGKIGVRFINLSPDAGALTCNLITADGNLSNMLPDQLAYGQISPYLYLDNANVTTGLIKLSMNNTEKGIGILTGVPFSAGRKYVVVVTGFANDQQRRVNSGKNADGTTTYTQVTINKQLRAIVRNSY